MSRSRSNALAASVGLVVDAMVGDEPLRPHPVALFGRAMAILERHIWDDCRLAGIGYALSGVIAAGAGGALLDQLPFGPIAAGYTATAGRGLWSAASAVSQALEKGDVTRARGLLPALVGRDPANLDSSEISRAAVESVAENTVDGIVAPVLWGAVGGAAGALTYRAVNTLDSMVGYRNERYENFGWAGARLDDMANYVPSRVTALLVAAVRPQRWREIWWSVHNEAPSHPSPNAGVAEAAFAAALDLRLGGKNEYQGRVEHRATTGTATGRPAAQSDISRAIVLSQHVALLLSAVLAASGCAQVARRPHRSERG
ncbi:MAG: adenosylcobinamide-phosphate synthase CbiB [Acidimicrobiales bacterium]